MPTPTRGAHPASGRTHLHTGLIFRQSGVVQNANSENTRAHVLKCKESPWHAIRARRGWRRGVEEEPSSLGQAWAWRQSVLDPGAGPGGVWPQIPRPGTPSAPTSTRAFAAQVVAWCACLTHPGPRCPWTWLSWAPGHQPARAGLMGSGRGSLHRQPRSSRPLGVCLQAAPLGSVLRMPLYVEAVRRHGYHQTCCLVGRRPPTGMGACATPPGRARAGPHPGSTPPCRACVARLSSSPMSAWLVSPLLRATTRARGSQRPGQVAQLET